MNPFNKCNKSQYSVISIDIINVLKVYYKKFEETVIFVFETGHFHNFFDRTLLSPKPVTTNSGNVYIEVLFFINSGIQNNIFLRKVPYFH